MTPPPIIGHVVAVVWSDAHADAKAEMSQEEVSTMGAYVFTTLGFLVRQDEKIVAVAAEQGEDKRWRGVTFIPAQMVSQVVDLGPLRLVEKKRRARRLQVVSQSPAPTRQVDAETPPS